ncbi:hypothetical protein MMC13_007917, partial [Lambiella insularis]|nr:hypothetical protein [Lambiella insularis]
LVALQKEYSDTRQALVERFGVRAEGQAKSPENWAAFDKLYKALAKLRQQLISQELNHASTLSVISQDLESNSLPHDIQIQSTNMSNIDPFLLLDDSISKELAIQSHGTIDYNCLEMLNFEESEEELRLDLFVKDVEAIDSNDLELSGFD